MYYLEFILMDKKVLFGENNNKNCYIPIFISMYMFNKTAYMYAYVNRVVEKVLVYCSLVNAFP